MGGRRSFALFHDQALRWRASRHLQRLSKGDGAGPVVVTKSGEPAGVLLAIDSEEELERLILA